MFVMWKVVLMPREQDSSNGLWVAFNVGVVVEDWRWTGQLGDKGGIFLSCSTAMHSLWVGFVEQPCILCGWDLLNSRAFSVELDTICRTYGPFLQSKWNPIGRQENSLPANKHWPISIQTLKKFVSSSETVK